MALQRASHEQVERLVGAAHFNIGLHGYGIIRLSERIEKFVNGNRTLFLIPFGKIVTFEHAGYGAAAHKA